MHVPGNGIVPPEFERAYLIATEATKPKGAAPFHAALG
jgi:hypothetical protein